jgi:hypothetical protein
MREGNGKCIYPNGDTYDGNWIADKKMVLEHTTLQTERNMWVISKRI